MLFDAVGTQWVGGKLGAAAAAAAATTASPPPPEGHWGGFPGSQLPEGGAEGARRPEELSKLKNISARSASLCLLENT